MTRADRDRHYVEFFILLCVEAWAGLTVAWGWGFVAMCAHAFVASYLMGELQWRGIL